MTLKSRIGNFIKPSGSKVITMEQYRKGHTLSPLRQVEAYWTALCDDDIVPRRSQIDPRGLENILRYTFIGERIAPGIARIRVAGQHLYELTGLELRGMPLTSLMSARSRSDLQTACEAMFERPAIVELQMQTTDRSHEKAHMILLPLSDEFGRVNRILGVLSSELSAGATPVRFDILQTQIRDASGNSDPVFSVTDQNPEFAEERAKYTGAPTYLRLVSSKED